MSSKKNVIIFVIILGVFFLSLIYFLNQSQKQIVYVDNNKLFESFIMTKEMKKTGQKEFNTKRKVLDSLYFLIESPTIDKVKKDQLLKTFIPLKEEFENFNQTFGQTESAKIWNRIDSYVKQYGKEKGYKVVLGYSNGDRTVLYNDEKIDITAELIYYINKTYEGKK